jgi:hypothetical protein
MQNRQFSNLKNKSRECTSKHSPWSPQQNGWHYVHQCAVAYFLEKENYLAADNVSWLCIKTEVCEIGSNTSQTATQPLPFRLTQFIQFHKENTVPKKGDQAVMITQLGIGTNAVQEVVASLRYWKICCCLFPCLQMDKHKCIHINIASQLLKRMDAENGYFLLNTVSNNKIWYHSFNPNCRWQGMQWHKITSPNNKKARTVPLARDTEKRIVVIFYP